MKKRLGSLAVQSQRTWPNKHTHTPVLEVLALEGPLLIPYMSGDHIMGASPTMSKMEHVLA